MAKIYSSTLSYIPTGVKTIYSARGSLYALLLSHPEATVQTVTIYDNGSAASGDILMTICIAPDQNPVYIQFAKDILPEFTNGITIDAGNCHVFAFVVGV